MAHSCPGIVVPMSMGDPGFFAMPQITFWPAFTAYHKRKWIAYWPVESGSKSLTFRPSMNRSAPSPASLMDTFFTPGIPVTGGSAVEFANVSVKRVPIQSTRQSTPTCTSFAIVTT